MKFVFDTNVLLSAHVSVGMSKQILDHCIEKHQVLLSEFIITEFVEKAEKKFKWPKDQCAFAAWNLRSHATLVIPQPLPKPICRDRDDDAILATAIAAKCDALVTGDKDLLDVRRIGIIRILRTSQLLDLLSSEP